MSRIELEKTPTGVRLTRFVRNADGPWPVRESLEIPADQVGKIGVRLCALAEISRAAFSIVEGWWTP